MKNYEYIAFIGRFQPFHNGHMLTLEKAFQSSQKVIIILGSCNSPRTFKNPWTAEEREIMIRSSLDNEQNKSLEFVYMEDRLYNNQEWENLVRKRVFSKIEETCDQIVIEKNADPNRPLRVAIIGYNKDSSSYYIKAFPEWALIDTGPHIKERNKGHPLSSTKIRELLFTDHFGYTESNLPEGVYSFIENFMETQDFELIQREFDHYEHEEREYRDVIPYHMNFYTADPVVIQSGHVLMVKRGHCPGLGLWALPGGHVNPNETSFEAAIRELKEETNLKIPKKVLMGSYADEHIFDHPDRSLRCRVTGEYGRTTTHAHCFILEGIRESGDVAPLPTVSNKSEEVLDVRWISIDKLRDMRSQIFEDHLDIIEYFVYRMPSSKFSTW